MWTYFIFHLFLLYFPEMYGNFLTDIVGNTLNTVANPLTKKCKIAKGTIIDEKDIHFYLYSKLHPGGHELNINDKATIEQANFNEEEKIVVLLHGYRGGKSATPNDELVPVYLKHTNCYVISVDYGTYAKKNCYLQLLKSSKAIARYINMLIDMIIRTSKHITLNRIHLIGFSQGSHIAGLMGYLRGNDGRYGRITALEPALLLHNFGLFFRTLKKSDAIFVDVLHTNMGFFGKVHALGDVDFYANNGVLQPGCGFDVKCSHFRSVAYYAVSIMYGPHPKEGEGIWAAKCTTFLKCFCRRSKKGELVLFGEYVDRKLTGSYYFITKKTYPYALGKIQYKEKTKKSRFWNKKKNLSNRT